jgi:hypothetical protein
MALSFPLKGAGAQPTFSSPIVATGGAVMSVNAWGSKWLLEGPIAKLSMLKIRLLTPKNDR